MATALLITDSEILADIYALNLKAYVDLDCVHKNHLQDSLIYLETNPQIEIIITEDTLKGQKIAAGLFNFIIAREIEEFPIIIIGARKKISAPQLFFVDNRFSIREVIRKSAKCLNVTAHTMAQKKVPDFFPIPSRTFIGISDPQTDVFQKLYNDQNEICYENVYDANAKDISKLNKILKSGVNELYVPATDRLKFTNLVSQSMANILGKPHLSTSDRLVASNAAYEFVLEHIHEIKDTEQLVQISKACVDSMTYIIEESPKAKNLLKALFENQSSYSFKHSQLIAFIGSFITLRHEWGTKEHVEKIAYIAFFHDLYLPMRDLVLIQNNEDLQNASLDPDEEKLVIHHAEKAAELVASLPRAPIGADIIIKQHHGTMGGVGFEKKKFSNNLSPLTIIFIIAEEYTHRLLQCESFENEKFNYESFDHKKTLDDLLIKFPNSLYKRAIKTLETLDLG